MSDTTQSLERLRHKADEAIEAMLPATTRRPAVLHTAMRDAVMSGGKRLRPCLCLAVCECICGDATPARNAAAAIELLHTYTLVHDDLPSMDDDDVRRGAPTCHITYGEANAILAGDALQALAFQAVATSEVAPEQAIRMTRELALAAGSSGVVGGQVEDMAAEGQALAEDTMNFIHLHKTADLFRAACRMGAIAADADAAQLATVTDYATALGLAFQIIDDIHDGEASGDMNGSNDNGSCLRVFGMTGARQRAATHTDAANAAAGRLPNGALLQTIANLMLKRTT